MVHAQSLFQQLVLRRDHVVIVILRKMSVHAVARLAGFSVADVIRQNDVIARDIKELPRPKKHTPELRSQELSAGTRGAVQKQHGIGNSAVRVAYRSTKGCVVYSQLGQRFARFEMEIVGNVVTFLGGGQLAWLLRRRSCWAKKQDG